MLGASLLAAGIQPVAASTKPNPVWSPFPLPAAKSVIGHPLAPAHGRLAVREAAGVAAREYTPTRPAWPAAGNGTLPVSVSEIATVRSEKTADANLAPAAVRVAAASRGAALAAGVNGEVLSLQAPRAGSASVRLSYAGFATAYGGGWASRLRLVELPRCALTTPRVAACRRPVPLAGVNDTASDQLTATVPLAAAGADTVVAATAAPAGAGGNYTATSLKPSGTWATQDGDFTYSYPITVPPALGGAAPSVALSYDSQSIDGETSGTNTQASWIGDGWDYSPGFIETSYQPCSGAGIANSGDQCWAGYNATLSLDGHSSALVRDDATGAWHLQSDDGTSVQEMTGASNGLWDGQYWVVTTTDGTQYYFGLDHLPGGNGSDASTNSAWGVPVYSPSSGNPCYSASSGSSSECFMGYRWNLDYVVDPHQNLTVYDYATETNYYQMGGGQGAGTLTQYVRGGYPTSISYGYQLPAAITGAQPAAQVLFGVSQRCLPSATFTDCSYSNLSASTAAEWPDAPYDENCGSSGTCGGDSPTFWSTVRLTSITTQVLEGSSYQQVDSYALTQSFPDAGGGADTPVMFLGSIQHTGEDGTPVSLPAVTFTPTEIDNRVDGLTPAAPPLYRPRISVIDTEYGSAIGIIYAAPACSRVNNTMPAAADTNTMPCYPVYWTPPGESSPIEDWFNKSLVTSVSVVDETGAGSPAQVTNYQYLGGAAWHQNESPLTPNSQRTWDQFRGYAQVETTTGTAPDPVTETVDKYLRGMDGDPLAAGGTASVSVTDSLGDSVTDSNWLAGQVLESDTYTASGGTVDAKTVNGPWTYPTTATQAQPDGLPDLVASMAQSAATRTMALLASGSWRTVTKTTTYNGDAQVTSVQSSGDGTSSDPPTCSSTTYASSTANPMMESYPSEVTDVTGPCGTTPSTATTVTDTRMYYDGSGNGSLTNMGTLGVIAGGGSVTGTQVISDYDLSGAPQYQAKDAATYDAYGRALTSVDAKGNVTSTGYTPSSGVLPTSMTVTNPMGWTTKTTLDPARGQPLTVTDPNGEVTTETYDGLGRAAAVWLPGRSTSSSANDTFAYSVTGAAPSTITSSTLREDGSYAAVVQIYDGILQLREQQQTPDNAAAGRDITDTFYDSHGWTVKTSGSYYDKTTSPDATLFVADDTSVPSQTVTVYDGQGRPVASKFYSLGQFQWQTTTAYPGADETDVTPPAGGTAASTFTNALGETTASWAYSGSSAPDGKASDAKVTSYTYTPGGQTASITDNAGNKWVYTYDLLGQKASASDPDSGTTSYGYDLDGNETSSTDPRGQTIVDTYDALNRKTAEYSGSVSAANKLASWTYDTLAKGQVTSSTSYASGASGPAYTEAVTGYDDAYQATGTSLTIPSAEGKLAGTYTTSSTYSPLTNDLESTQYSADAGLPDETVNYAYDQEGELSAVGGNAPYLDAVSYSPFGQVLRTTSGLYGSQLAVTSSYDAGTGLLLHTADDVQPTGASAVDATAYTYDDAGNITSVSDAQNTGQTDTQCFAYDDLDELITAWADTAGTNTAPGPSVEGIGGCDTTTPSAATIGGPAPYWESWTYDPLGDRTSQTTHDTSGNTADNITQTLSYPGGNGTSSTSEPDSVSTVATTGPGGTTTTSYSYDAAGDTTSRTSSGTGSSPPAGPDQSFSYDPEDQVSSVTTTSGGTSQTSGYLYDAGGNLLIQRDPGSTTLYLENGAEQLTLNTSTGSVSGTRFYTEPDGTTVIRSSSGTLTYQLANQQGTGTELIDASTLAVTRRYYDPYGDPRGAVPSSWADNLGFLNQPADPTESLDLLGARQYDPVTGRFLSVDPYLEAGDSRQMGGYSYAGNDPVNGSDPSGQQMMGPGGGTGDPGGCNIMTRQCTSSGSGNSSNNNSNEGGSGNGYGSPEGSGGSGCWEPGGEYVCGASTLPPPAKPAPKPNPPKPSPENTQSSAMVCSRFGACTQTTSPSGGGGGGGFGSIFRKALHTVGDVTGINQIVGCVTHPTLGTCAQAAIMIGMDSLDIADDGASSELNEMVDAGFGAGEDAAADLTAEAGGDGAAAADAGTSSGVTVNCGESFTASTKVLLASGAAVAIASLEPGDKVLAANTKAGKTQAEPVTAVLVHHDTDLYDLTVKTGHGTAVVHTTSSHLFWDPYLNYWVPASKLKKGEHLKTPDGTIATADGGSTPKVHDGWMWDLTVPGSGDHDFYVLLQPVSSDHTYHVEAGATPVLVHNSNCGQIAYWTKHGADQATNRNISEEMADNAVKNGRRTPGNTPGTTKYSSRTVWVVLNDTCGVVSCGWK
jgi:RHS repeat-associated protein